MVFKSMQQTKKLTSVYISAVHLLVCYVKRNIPLLLLLLLLTAIELSLGGSSPYTSTDKTNKNKYT